MTRSQSFNVQNATPVRTLAPVLRTAEAKNLANEIVKTGQVNSPLYKSTPYLNKMDSMSILKSPGMISSISKSQLELNKSTSDLNNVESYNYNNSLYTLPRKRPEKVAQEPSAPAPTPAPAPVAAKTTNLHRSHSAVQPGMLERAESAEGIRESFSSMHRRKMMAANTGIRYGDPVNIMAPLPLSSPVKPAAEEAPIVPSETVTYQSSTKATHRSFRGSSETSRTSQSLGGINEENEAAQKMAQTVLSPAPVPVAPPSPIPVAPPAPIPAAPPIPVVFPTLRPVPPPIPVASPAAAAPADEEDDAPENKSLRDRIALLESAGIMANHPAGSNTLPRVVSTKAKGPAPPPPPRVSSVSSSPRAEEPVVTDIPVAAEVPVASGIPVAPELPTAPDAAPVDESEEAADEEDGVKKTIFLKGLLNAAPELFMHIHGNEDLEGFKVEKEDVIGESSRPPRTPSPMTPVPPLTKPLTPRGSPPAAQPTQSFTFPPENRANLNRVYTSTPVLNEVPSSKHSTSSERNEHSPLQPLLSSLRRSSLLRSKEHLAGSGSLQDVTVVRRGSLNSSSGSNGGGVIIPAVKIPDPVDYSETIRMKSVGDPDSTSHVESDSVQTYSKRTIPYEDGFCSETMQSTEKTTVTRSESVSTEDSQPADFGATSIRPQESGGVIIQLRGEGEE